MDLDFSTLACTFGIPKWWLELNFDKNTDKGLQSYMKSLHKKWTSHSTKIRNIGWYVPNYKNVKDRYFEIGVDKRPCYDCKKEIGYNDVAYIKCFSHDNMPIIHVGENIIKHFNLFVLCQICASKEKVIKMTNNPEKAIDQQHKKSRRQLVLEAEFMEEHLKYVEIKQQLDGLKRSQKELDAEIKLKQPLLDKLKQAKDENDNVRAELKKFNKQKSTVASGFQGCADIGNTILEALGQFNKEIKSNTKELDRVTDNFEQTFKNEKKCGVCWDKIDVYVALKPCYHVYCQKCSYNSSRCPLCNKNVKGHQVVHFP